MNHPRAGWVVLALLSLFLVACGGDAPGDVGGGLPPGNAACAPGELTVPDGRCQPAGLPPDMPCPPGERALPDGSCQPAGVPAEACAAGRFVPDGRSGCEAILPEEACPPGLMAVPGESACREVAPCGEGRWGDIPVEANTQYVEQGYAGSDSDGSQQKPWTTVQAGVDAAAAGAIVAVAEGRYDEDVLIVNKPVRLWGRCPARTEVAGRGQLTGAISVSRERASGAEVRGLAVTGPLHGVFVRGARSVVLEAVWVHEARSGGVVTEDRAGVTLRRALVEQNHIGVFVVGSEATVEATVVRAHQPDVTRSVGRGIDVEHDAATGEGGKLSLTASLVEQNRGIGVLVLGSEATVEATVVRANQPDGAGIGGWGINVRANPVTGERGKLSLTASLIEENVITGVFVEGSEATVESTVVRATQLDGAGSFGQGIIVSPDPAMGEGGKLSLTASLIEQNHDAGVFVSGSEATVEATVVRATQPDGAGTGGQGLITRAGGKLSLTASLVEQNHEVGVFVEGSEATVEATVVRATQPGSAGRFGRGIAIQSKPATGGGGKLSLTASLIEQNHEIGVFVGGSEATVLATVVRATQPDGTGTGGRGIAVQSNPATGEGSQLSLTASLVEQNRDTGLLVEGSEATVESTVVRATQPNDAGIFGRGISAQGGSQLSLTASLIEQNYDTGVFVAGSEATIAATAVRGTKLAPANKLYGDGILVAEYLRPSSAVITATESTDNDRAGVLYMGASGDLSGVWSSRNRFGLVLQPGTSEAQPALGEGNVFEGNTEQDKVAAGDLPVPDAAPPLP